MLATATSYPAKVLLFGEHVLLRGGTGLSVPYPRLSLRWTRGETDERLLAFAEYLRGQFGPELLDGDRLDNQLREGLRLTGNIPVGYGLGSSGAVCAAVWDRFATEEGKQMDGDLRRLRALFARMEQHFHGKSSGTDPLISYLGRGFILGNGVVTDADIAPTHLSRFFLLDTGQPRSASPLIEDFLRRWDKDSDFQRKARRRWLEASRRAVWHTFDSVPELFYEHFKTISNFQLKELPHFIPEAYRGVWDGGRAYRLKLCGAGGGGMLLGAAWERGVVERVIGEGVVWLV